VNGYFFSHSLEKEVKYFSQLDLQLIYFPKNQKSKLKLIYFRLSML